MLATPTILTLDPGITTGYVLSVIDGTHVHYLPGQEIWNELGLYNFLSDWSVDYIICEDFEYREYRRKNSANVGVELFSRNLIGVVNLYVQTSEVHHEVWGLKIPRLFMQKPSTGVGGHFKDSDRLKELGLWIPGKTYHHSMSAMRHFMMWLHYGYGFQYIEGGLVLTYTRNDEDSFKRYFKR